MSGSQFSPSENRAYSDKWNVMAMSIFCIVFSWQVGTYPRERVTRLGHSPCILCKIHVSFINGALFERSRKSLFNRPAKRLEIIWYQSFDLV
eukprot:c3056_g1_i1 orf=74-349(-)